MAKRRANGEGSIRKRSDGRWEGRYTIGHHPETGKQLFKNVLAKTQTECKEKLKKAIETSQKVDIIKAEQQTLGEWMDTWFENYAKIKVRPTSHQTYNGYIENHIKPNLGSKKLSKLTSLDLQKFYKYLLENGRVDRVESEKQNKGLSPKTVRNIHQVISSALDVAKSQRLVEINVAESCSLPKVEQKEMKTLTIDDLNRFFEESKRSGVYEMYFIEITTGLRRGELLGLKWTDIDFETQTIRVQRQINRIDGVVQESALKTKNSYRTISIGSDSIEVLKEQKKKSVGEYVFSSKGGQPISPDSVLHMLHRVLKRAGLEKMRFHDLRHTFATIALQNGVDIKTLSNMLGHFSAGFTLDTYTHVTNNSQVAAANIMNDVMSGIA